MKQGEIQIGSELLYKGKILRLRRDEVKLPNGKTSVREVVEHNGGVGVLPVRGDRVFLVEQFRYPYGEFLLEIPAGKREGEEAPEACGLRELAEETGLRASALLDLGILYPSPGYTEEKIWLFCAEDFEAGECRPDEDEFLNVKEMKFSEALQMAVSGKIRDAKTVAALLKYDAIRKK